MFDEAINTLLGTKKSRHIAFATLFFALLYTFLEAGIQLFLDERLDPPLARLVLAGVLTIITTVSLKVLDILLVRCRSGIYLYGLCLETPAGPHFIVGYFEAEYDAKKNRHRVETAVCFDCDDLKPGARLVDIAQPRARWTADKIWLSPRNLDIVYELEMHVRDHGTRARGGTPNRYLGLMLLQARHGLSGPVQYQGEVKYVEDSDAPGSHGHHGHVYCEKVRRKGKSRQEWVAMIEQDLWKEKARHLVDAVAQVRNEKLGIGIARPHVDPAQPGLICE